MLSGAAIAFAALLLIIPGFITDVLGFILIFPPSRKLIFEKVIKKKNSNRDKDEKEYIDGEFEEIEEKDDDKKI